MGIPASLNIQPPSVSTVIKPKYLRLLTGLLLLFYLIGVFTTRFDRDEWQAMVAAAGIANGASLYVDIWDNHGPLLPVFLSKIILLLDTRNHALLMFGGRLLIYAMLLSTLWLTGSLARRVLPESPLAPPLAMLVLLCSQIFFDKCLEIRPDVPLLLIWTLCLVLLQHALTDGKAFRFTLAGLSLGIGFAFSLKTLLFGAACGLALLIVMIRRRRFSPGWLLAFGAGVVPAPLAMSLSLHRIGNLNAFLTSYLGQNFDRVPESWLTGLTKAWHAEELLLLSFLAVLVYCIRFRRRILLPEGIIVLLTISIALFLLYLRLPTHFDQSLLPLLPAAAVVIAWGIEQLPPTIRVRHRTLNVTHLLLLVVLLSSFDHSWFRYKSGTDLKTAEARQSLLPGDALLFEGIGLPLFQPRPFIYKSFVSTLCSRIREGQLGIDIPAGLDSKDVGYAVWDGRVASMGNEVQSFILQNYLPLRGVDLLAAGTVLPAGHNAPVKWQVRIAGRYFFSTGSTDSDLRVDGMPAGKTIDLTDGPHTFTWSGQSPLILCIAPQQQWAAVDTMTTWMRRGASDQLP